MKRNTIHITFVLTVITGSAFVGSLIAAAPVTIGAAMFLSGVYGLAYSGENPLKMAKEYAKMTTFCMVIGCLLLFMFDLEALKENWFLFILSAAVFLPVTYACSYFMFAYGAKSL